MKAALIALAGAIVIALQSATFYYVREVEHRLTRLETLVMPPARVSDRSS